MNMNKFESNIDQFKQVVHTAIDNFKDNWLFKRVDSGQAGIIDYHNYLRMIFNQTYEAPGTFALAGANCSSDYWEIRDYLIRHAEEERTHWQWVIEDLESTGYKGPDVRTVFAPIECQQYVAYNQYLATKMPVARLGAAAVLEGIGGTYAKAVSTKVASLMKLNDSQLKFTFGHGDTDVGHTKDIFDLLQKSSLPPREWANLTNAAFISGQLYKQMYNGVQYLK